MGFLSRRRSFLIKLIVVVTTAWFTVAFLLYTENRALPAVNSISAEGGELPALPEALRRDTEKPVRPPRQRLSNNNNNEEGVLAAPISSYGENGKPVVLPTNLSSDIKKLVDEGWLKNAFNQYASDLISVRRSLPDPRDEW